MRQLLGMSVLFLGACLAGAQTTPTQDATPMTPTQATSAAATTVEGCLSGSSGNYMLTDTSGNSFTLTGDTAKLNEHVGHEVKVTGTTSAASSAAPSAAPSTDTTATASGTDRPAASTQQTLEVTSVAHVAKTCKTPGTSH